MTTDFLIKTLEEKSLNAIPGLQQILYDGWIIRLSEGYTKIANSVSPLYESIEDVETKILSCEQIYNRFKLPTIFRLTPIAQPANLDLKLAQAGYLKRDLVSVQVKDLISTEFTGERQFIITNELSEEWLDRLVHIIDLPLIHWGTIAAMLEIIPNSTCYALLKDKGKFCACGLGVLDGEYLGLFFINTITQQRRQGYERDLISKILNWGTEQGATKAYLQVEINDRQAIAFYAKLGFEEAYQYFYRFKARDISQH